MTATRLAAVLAAVFASGCGGNTSDPPPNCLGASPAMHAPLGSPGPGRLAWSAPVLEPVARIPMPGPAVRFDYQSADTGANRLYISHMDAGEMIVFDLQTEQVVDTVGGLPTVTGVLVVPELGKVYASVTGNHAVAVINDTTLRIEAQVGPIGFPDGIAYAPAQRKVYVSDESGGGELVIDGVSNRSVATIPIGGRAGNTIYDAGSGCILVAVGNTNQLVAIDPRTDQVTRHYSPAGAALPHGMYVDADRRLLFVASYGSAMLSVIDLRTMQVIGTAAIGLQPDVLAFDPVWRRLYVASESGVVSVFTELDAGVMLLGQVTAPLAHTVAVDPRSHLVYLPLENVNGQPMLWIMAGTPPSPAGPAGDRARVPEPAVMLSRGVVH